MKNVQRLASALLVSGATLFLAFGGTVAAATSSGTSATGNGMKVSPVRSQLVLSKGETKTISVFVQNVSNANENLQVIVNDFTSKDETGAPSILLNGQSDAQHGLKQFVSTTKTVQLAPSQQKEIKVTISIPQNAAGGGYYGVVRFAPVGLENDKIVNLAASVGSLVLVTVPGNLTEKVGLTSFNVSKGDKGKASTLFTSGKELQLNARFENNGNVQEQPYGKVQLKKGSKVVGTYEINNVDPRGNVLPDSIRRFTVPLKDAGSFGKYTVEGNFGYGTNGQLLTGKSSFYVIPVGLIIAVIIVILLIILAIFMLPRMIRNYNRSVVRKASRR